jgi:serine/threonine protein kinase
MEYLPGKSLAAALGDMEPVGDIATLANIGDQVARALQAVHGRRMIHRALKSDSIVMTSPAPHPVIKLLDFGVANFTQSVRHSQTGSLLGAPLYMSPEVGRGLGNVDHRADIYSLGCILFEMATGRPPFVREGAGQLIIAHSTEAAPAAKALEPSIPPELDDLINRCLRKDPSHRPQSMSEISAVLARFSTSAAPTPAPVFAQSSPPALPQQVVTPPPASLSAFLQRASANSRASVTPMPVQPPSAATGAAASSPRPARKHEPTALLQPSEPASPGLSVSPPTKPPAQRNPVVRQPTALLEPPPTAVVVRDTSRKRVSRCTPAPEDEPAPRSRAINFPIIAMGGVIVLCVVAIIVFLLVRKAPSPKAEQTSPAPSRAAPREEFQPPSPLPALAEPTPAHNTFAQPPTHRSQPARPAAKPETRTPRSKSLPAAEKSAPTKPKEAPRW